MKKCIINNITMGNARRTKEYQCLIIDLALNGVITKEKAESMLGYEIPEYIKSVDGTNITGKKIDTIPVHRPLGTVEKEIIVDDEEYGVKHNEYVYTM